MAADRLRQVMLENLPWQNFIRLYDSPGTFFFVDPPYIGHNEYRHNFKQADMAALATALRTIKGRFLLTHTEQPEIRELFDGFSFEPVQLDYTSQRQKGKVRTMGRELLVTNY